MNLFIVEDSLLIQNRLMRFVKELPEVHIVGIADELQGTLDSIYQAGTQAMILDIQLRDGNGLNLLKQIKAMQPHIRVMVLTNHASDANRMQALRAGADSFLDKSTDFEQIPDLLHRWQNQTSAHDAPSG